MNTIETAFEIVPADCGLELTAKNSLELAFSGFFTEAEKWKLQAAAITDPKLARTARLEIRKLRGEVEKTRKDLKEDSLRMSKAIDGASNMFLAAVVPIEKSLEDIEKRAEREEAARISALQEVRATDLLGVGFSPAPNNLGTLTEDQWNDLFQGAKDIQQVRLERERVAREEAEAAAKKEAEEREAQRLENIRLKEEAEKAAAALEVERKERAAAELKAKTEREAAERKANEERAAAEAQARKEREAAEAAARAAAEKAKAEREAAEAAAKAEREKLETIAAEERRKAAAAAAEAAKKQAAAEAEAKALREAEDKRVREAREAAEARAKAEELAAKKAAAAPDKSKLLQFATSVRALSVPDVKSEDGKRVAAEVAAKVENFAAWIEKQAATL